MATYGEMIASAAALTTMYAERLIQGVKAEDFARFARPGGVAVQSNHPAFILGHLSLYPRRVLEHLGQTAGVATYPATWDGLFQNGVECRDDPRGDIYPPMAEISRFFFDGYRAAAEVIRVARDAQLSAPNPAEGRMRELFPTLGAMLAFYLCGHPQVHLGQFSAWRRMMGLPAA